MISREIARTLLKEKAVFLRPHDPFTWTSGIKSPVYCDNRLLISTVTPREMIVDAFCEEIKKLNIDIISGTATAGIPWAAFVAQKLLKDAGRSLGRKASFLVNLFNPELLIIGGGIEIGGAIFMDAVRDTIKLSSIPEATEKLRIIPSQLGENGIALGAVALVAQNYFISVSPWNLVIASIAMPHSPLISTRPGRRFVRIPNVRKKDRFEINSDRG